MQTISINGEGFEFTDEAAPLVRGMLSQYADLIASNLSKQAELAALDAAHAPVLAAKDAELQRLDDEHRQKVAEKDRIIAEIKATTVSQTEIHRLADELCRTIADAQRVCPTVDTASKTADEIRRAVVSQIKGCNVTDKSADYVAGIFHQFVQSVPTQRTYLPDALGAALAASLPPKGRVIVGDNKEQAYQEMCEDLSNAWKH